MGKDYNVRLFEKGDIEEIVELLKMGFPTWARDKNSVEHYKWKHIESPLGSDIVVASSEGKIIGAVHFLYLNFKIGDSRVIGTLSGDSVTHPDFRGMGVFSKIVALSDKISHSRFQYSSSVNPYILQHRKKTPDRVDFPHSMSYMLRIKNVDLHFKMKQINQPTIKNLGLKTLKAVNKIYKFKTGVRTDFKVEEIQRFDDNIEKFWERISGNYDFILERGGQFLNWRYCDPRAGNYLVMQATKEAEVLGFMVLNLETDGVYEEGFISDLLILPERLDVADFLFGKACEHFDKKGVNSITYLAVKGNPLLNISSRHGFIHALNLKHHVGCVAFDKKAYEVLRKSPDRRVYFCLGDEF